MSNDRYKNKWIMTCEQPESLEQYHSVV